MIKFTIIQKRIYSVFILIITLSFVNVSFANEANLAPGAVKGLVYDQSSDDPMEFTTVALKNALDSTLVDGSITDANGFFQITRVPKGAYFIEVSFMGYEEYTSDIFELEERRQQIDLGKITLGPSEATLNEVIVVADRPSMTYQIDKKVINVSQLHTSASGSAVDVLENIPSVTVNIEGEVSLRGSSSFTVLIDGKPSILEPNDILNQIPASQIENIEIITNPSARYDPGGVAGIINIVMKKNRRQGFNGVINLNGGTPGRYGGDFLVNYRRNRVNYFLGSDYNNRGYIGESVRMNESYGDVTSYLNSTGGFDFDRNSLGLRVGAEFTINPASSFSLGYRIADRERASQSERLYQEWSADNIADVLEYSSYEENIRGGTAHSLTLDYKHDFNRQGHGFMANLVLETSNGEDRSLNSLRNDLNQMVSGQRSIESGPSEELNFRMDYSLPFSDNLKFESGTEISIDIADELNTVYEFDSQSDNYVENDQFSMKVNYDIAIYALYSTLGGTWNKLGYQAGIRAEYTDRLVELIDDQTSFPLNRWDLYPTVHLSYDLPGEAQTMASYTRRLQRLRGWYLEPFFTWDDAYNVRIGNPTLDPEYIDSYEISYQYRFNDGNVLSTELYYRVTHNKIERIRSIYNNQPGIILSSMANVGQDFSLGVELMTGFDPFKWWHFDVMVNLFDYRQQGEFNGRNYEATSFNWNARLNNDFKIGRSTRIQLRGMYDSPTVTAQGTRTGYFVTHLALRQDFLDRAMSLTFQVSDIFGSSERETVYRDLDFYNLSRWDPQTPFFTLTFAYRINNYDNNRPGNNGNEGNRMNEEGEAF